MKVEIDCSEMNNEADFHKIIAQKLSFPSYYGKNLDALWDCLCCDVKRPIMLILKNASNLQRVLGERYVKILEVFEDCKEKDIAENLPQRFDYQLD